jgi:hypothetical protein
VWCLPPRGTGRSPVLLNESISLGECTTYNMSAPSTMSAQITTCRPAAALHYKCSSATTATRRRHTVPAHTESARPLLNGPTTYRSPRTAAARGGARAPCNRA